MPTFDSKYCQTRVLCGLGQAKEYKPQDALCSGGDWKCHLCKGEDVEGYAQ